MNRHFVHFETESGRVVVTQKLPLFVIVIMS